MADDLALIELGEKVATLEALVRRLAAADQLTSSTLGAADDPIDLSDAVDSAVDASTSIPQLQDDIDEVSTAASDLANLVSASTAEVDARLELAATDLAEAREQIEDAQQQITDAFGQQIGDLSTDVQTAINAAGNAQSSADAKPLILFSSTRGPSNGSDLAPTGSTWFLIDTSNNIMGQWQQTGSATSPTWTPRAITSDVVANLDVGKLTAGQAAIATVVAQKIAASTANFQTVNVSNLFVTSGATMQQAVIDYLFANVVQAKKITADMIDVNSLNGVTLTGTIVQTGTVGKRAVLGGNLIRFYDENNLQSGRIEGMSNGAAGGLLSISPDGGGATTGLLVGTYVLPTGGSANGYTASFYTGTQYVDDIVLAASGVSFLRGPSAYGNQQANQTLPAGTETRLALPTSTQTYGITKQANGSGHQFLLSQSGWYAIYIAVNTANFSASRWLRLRQNASRVGQVDWTSTSSSSMVLSMSPVALSSGDTIDFTANSGAAGTWSVSSFGIRFIGPL